MASHHRMVDPVLGPLRAALADVSPTRGVSRSAPPWSIPARSRRCATPIIGRPMCASRCGSPGHHRRRGSPCPVHRDQPAPDADVRHQRNLGGEHHHAIGTLARDTDDTSSFHTNLNAAHTTTPHPPPIHPNPTRSSPPPPGTTPTTGSPHRTHHATRRGSPALGHRGHRSDNR